MLDKKRLRTLFSSVAGIFTTVIPVILAFSKAESMDTVYGQRLGSLKLYAYSPVDRTYAESVAFCESIWMEPASLHSPDENADALTLMDTRDRAWIGAVGVLDPACAADCTVQQWSWQDGSAWDYESWAAGMPEYQDDSEPGRAKSGVVVSPGGTFKAGGQVVEDDVGTWADERRLDPGRRHGVICSAPSVAAIPGALPSIRNLGRVVVHGGTADVCELTNAQIRVIRGLLSNASNCHYNMTVESVLGDSFG
eukprot:SAG22_NODE_13_length_33548_cov_57.167773_6_plen_252_part_00